MRKVKIIKTLFWLIPKTNFQISKAKINNFPFNIYVTMLEEKGKGKREQGAVNREQVANQCLEPTGSWPWLSIGYIKALHQI